MDALFEKAPLFVPGTPYTRVGDRHAAERQLREGNFAPGDLSTKDDHEPEKLKASIQVDHKEI
ncbi:hypothetical protein C0992_008257 [Termitomyces sp. T32_za158]|nr:hypothetical protein C0992_008257 [Termitomyces sp. T32_za158]